MIINSSVKKHTHDMTNKERAILFYKLTNVKKWYHPDYLLKRMSERKIKMHQVMQLIEDSDLIEFHRRNNNNRILLRGKIPYRNRVVCAVFDLDGEKIITAYWNTLSDTHLTLDETNYTKKLNVLDYITF